MWKFWCFVWFALGCWCLDLAGSCWVVFRVVYILLFRFGFAVRADCLEFAGVWGLVGFSGFVVRCLRVWCCLDEFGLGDRWLVAEGIKVG